MEKAIEKRELSEEEVAELVKEIILQKEKYQPEYQYILILELETRHEGCGYVYNYFSDYAIFMGEAQRVTLDVEETYDCVTRQRVAIIPQSVPVVIIQHNHDDQPTIKDRLIIHVFDGESWKSLVINVPKHFRLDP
jgi:hypothetical protein